MNENLASRGSRFLATVIDVSPFVVMQIIKHRLRSIGVGHTTFMNILVVFLVLMFLYAICQIILLVKNGQTVGKKLVRIKIVDVRTGLNGGFVPNVLERGFLMCLLYIIPFFFFVDALFIFRDDRRCIHDFIAGTKVVTAD